MTDHASNASEHDVSKLDDDLTRRIAEALDARIKQATIPDAATPYDLAVTALVVIDEQAEVEAERLRDRMESWVAEMTADVKRAEAERNAAQEALVAYAEKGAQAEAAIERVKAIVPLCDITFAGGPVRVVRLADITRALAAVHAEQLTRPAPTKGDTDG